MRYQRVFLDAMGYEIAPNVVTSAWIEDQLAPVYRNLRIQPGQLEALTGIRERHWWDEGFSNAEGATRAARQALQSASVRPQDLEVVIYGGVCRDHIEPATACAVAAAIGASPGAEIFDLSNACLGVLNGVIAIANRIELGQIRAGMVVSCESSREISLAMIDRMNANHSMEIFKKSFATLTGGSGAVALVLTDGSLDRPRPQLLGGVVQSAPEYHTICRWETNGHTPGGPHEFMETDSVALLKHGAALTARTWRTFLPEMGWQNREVDRVICHQVGGPQRDAILHAFDAMPLERDYSTFEYLGNMGTVSLPLTAALAWERGVLEAGQRVGFYGIGSGLSAVMLGWQW